MKLNQQSRNELRVFKRFAEVCPYSINFDSIEKRNPSEPDILCKLSDGRTIAFEIVECIDSSLSRSISNSCKLGSAFYKMIEELPDERKYRVKSKFGDVLITVVFHEGIPLIKKRRLIEPIFNQLWTLENEKKIEEAKKCLSFLTPQEFQQFWEIIEKEGISEDELLKRPPFCKAVIKRIDLKLSEKLRDSVERMTFFPGPSGPSGGPAFVITDTVWEHDPDPIEQRIEVKLRKKYRTKHIAELLVYYELQPELPADYWILPAMDSVIEKAAKSIFKRVWLYSVIQNKIIYTFPELT
jgi:hypothetical protein